MKDSFYDRERREWRLANVNGSGNATWEDGTPVPDDAPRWQPAPKEARRVRRPWEWAHLWPKSVYERLKGKKLKPESVFFVGEDAVKVKHRSHP